MEISLFTFQGVSYAIDGDGEVYQESSRQTHDEAHTYTIVRNPSAELAAEVERLFA